MRIEVNYAAEGGEARRIARQTERGTIFLLDTDEGKPELYRCTIPNLILLSAQCARRGIRRAFVR